MKPISFPTRLGAVLLATTFGLAGPGLSSESPALKEGSTFDAGGRKATVIRIDALPFVESEYTKRFHFDSADNPKLKELRERYRLDDVVAPGKSEFDKQVLLMDWAHKRFKKFGQPSVRTSGALDILKGIEEGHSFFCSQYAELFVSSAASLGWIDRELALRRHQGVSRGGTTEHSTTEIWSNEHGKWVMLDPTANMYLERDGMPLNAYEIRQEWFQKSGKDLVFVVGKERKRFRKADLPIFLARFEGFGDLTVDPDELDKYGFIGYIPNTNLMDARQDYARMFIVKDELCAGTRWHVRTAPAHPAVDPYFPIGQAALSLHPEETRVVVQLKSFTPNFERFEMRMGGAGWKSTSARFDWPIEAGLNRLQARTLNRFGVYGPVSTVEVQVSR